MDHDKQTLKFAADRMLGKLAKWLRLMGQDVVYGPHLTGYGLIRAARQEGRLILTRDRRLKQKQPPAFLFIESDHYREQLHQIVRACDLDPLARAFTRCAECNAVLEPRAKQAVEKLVPPYVFSTQERFSACPQCRRIYWPATHHEKMLAELQKISLTEPRN
ncbi:MAG: Mut7-C RNAse domain-containing protein [Candidatus Binatia bacterium]